MATFTYANKDAFLAAASTVNGNSSNDTLSFSGGVTLGDVDFLNLTPVNLIESLVFANVVSRATLSNRAMQAGIVSVFGGSNTDYLDASGYSISVSLSGGGGNDSFIGNFTGYG